MYGCVCIMISFCSMIGLGFTHFTHVSCSSTWMSVVMSLQTDFMIHGFCALIRVHRTCTSCPTCEFSNIFIAPSRTVIVYDPIYMRWQYFRLTTDKKQPPRLQLLDPMGMRLGYRRKLSALLVKFNLLPCYLLLKELLW